MNPELRAKYKKAFGSACYVAADANSTFNCFYKEEDVEGPKKDGKGQACKDAKRIGEVSELAVYDQDEKYTCQKNPATGDYTLQVGSDSSIKIDIKLGDAPVETSNIDVDGGASIAINGPYRNLPQLTTIKPGGHFNCSTGLPGPDGGTLSQRDWFIQVNQSANDGRIRSDMAGFMHPCKTGCPEICTEPEFLKEGDQYGPLAAQVNHVVRKTDLRGCKWGSNANTNAAVISGRLNRYLKNKYPLKDEVDWVNKAPPYTYTP